jgi:TPR repeat protein
MPHLNRQSLTHELSVVPGNFPTTRPSDFITSTIGQTPSLHGPSSSISEFLSKIQIFIPQFQSPLIRRRMASPFFLPHSRFSTTDRIFETKFVSLSHGSDSLTNESVLIHTMQFISFQSSDLLVFLRDLLSIHNSAPIPGVLPLIGITSTVDSFSVVYRLSGATPTDVRSLSSDGRLSLLRSIAQSIVVLHSAGIAHLRLKISSVFSVGAGFSLACFTPRAIVDLEGEDSELPFCEQTNQSCDVFLFGVLVFAVVENKTQIEVLDRLWRFEAVETKGDSTLGFGAKCLGFSDRPGIREFCEQFGSANGRIVRIDESEVRNAVFGSDSPLCQLLKAAILTKDGRVSEAIAAYEVLPESAIAMNNKAKLLLSRDTSPSTISAAVSLFINSATKGYAIGLMNAAHACLKGVGVPESREQMRAYISQAAEQGHLESMCIWAMEARSFDLTVSARYLRGAARKAEPQAIHMYGLALEGGIAFPGERSVDYFRVGAALGYPQCINNLGTHAPDFETANALWRRAAETGLKHACYNLAVSYKMGRGIEQDDKEAAKWMKKAADQKFANAMFDFAMMLRDGVGVEKDEAAAEELCMRAAEQRTVTFGLTEQSRKELNALMQTAPK